MYAYLAAQLLLAVAGVEGIAAASHEAEISHDGRALTVRYQAAPEVSLRQVGYLAGNRPSTAACIWTARLAVRRDVIGSDGPLAAFARPVQVGETISGRRPGACMGARQAIEQEAAARLGAANELAAIASADRLRLVAELDSAR